MSNYLKFFFFLLSFSLVISCSKDDDDDDESCGSTYDGNVKAIIDSSCAYSGCHDGTGVNTYIPAGAADFTTYAGLKASLDSGLFKTRSIDSLNMPPAAFVPMGFPTELTAAQLETLTCWHEEGYPEN